MNTMKGTGALIRLILRRDRIVLPIWIVLPALLALGIESSFAQLYHTPALLQAFANEVAGNPAEVALLGPIYAPTLAGITVWRLSFMGAILVALANLFTVTRHTRTEEEAGRRELLGSAVVGRHAALSAVLIVTGAANLLIALLVAGALIGIGFPVAGSCALGLSLAAVGWTFAALAAVTGQLAESAGSANGMAGGLLGLCYLLRTIGDMGLSWLSWLSPLGWMRFIRPFAAERWWIFALFIGLVAVLSILAYRLAARRDLGAGFLPPRLGSATAAPGLSNPFALAWRLQRGTLLVWIISFAIVGGAFGYVASTVAAQLSTNPQMMQLFAHMGHNVDPGEGFFTLSLEIFGEVAAAYAILATLRLRTEETSGRAEPVLANAVGRITWAISHLLFAILGPALVLLAFGLTAGLTYGISQGTVESTLPRILYATLAYLPAVWVLAGLAVVLFGLLPRLVAYVSWALLVACLLLDLGGELQQVNQAILNLSPFIHIPKLLVGDSSLLSLLWLSLIAAAFGAIGLLGFRRRAIG
ncbi:exporter of polyketide antibiotics [Dictyobacter sp. S3.2.2.5]|uniref:Exporter of polyketide antibiotics n=1 Tax=Dictyobacter halimunensis TaxID=3026934 RepID=A0ABQ6FQ45_9CHLR|nr:exporter of polyketide antibiotics [Dictyobacter sp. S3.2.2.5]